MEDSMYVNKTDVSVAIKITRTHQNMQIYYFYFVVSVNWQGNAKFVRIHTLVNKLINNLPHWEKTVLLQKMIRHVLVGHDLSFVESVNFKNDEK